MGIYFLTESKIGIINISLYKHFFFGDTDSYLQNSYHLHITALPINSLKNFSSRPLSLHHQ